MQNNDKNLWGCGYCAREFGLNNEKGTITQLGKMRGKTEIENLRCPYRPESFCNLANLKQHILHKRCANNEYAQRRLQWGDIAKSIEPMIPDENTTNNPTAREVYLEELIFSLIGSM